MERKYIVMMLLCGILFIFITFGLVLGSFDFTRSERLGKTNYYLMKGALTNVFELYYQYPDDRELLYGIEGGRITDVYWNDDYILAAQCDTWSDSIRGYYVIKMLASEEKGRSWEKVGPLSEEEYKKKKLYLGLNEKEMKHTNMYDNKHLIWVYVKSFAFVVVFLVVIIRVFRFFKSKVRE